MSLFKANYRMKIIDLTTPVSAELLAKVYRSDRASFNGHVGTHFDVMNKTFPLSYMELEGIVFDVSHIHPDREIQVGDINLQLVHEHQFVAFYTGFLDREGYATSHYFANHPQLSDDLMHQLCDKHICIIGVDFAGIKRGASHARADQYCADRHIFVVENLCNLSQVLNGKPTATFMAGTYPVNFIGQSGLPCRVIAKV